MGKNEAKDLNGDGKKNDKSTAADDVATVLGAVVDGLVELGTAPVGALESVVHTVTDTSTQVLGAATESATAVAGSTFTNVTPLAESLIVGAESFAPHNWAGGLFGKSSSTSSSTTWLVWLFGGLGVLLVGLIVWAVWPDGKK